MSFAEKKDIILNALIERNGLQYLTNVVAKALNNPFFILDISGKILTKSQDSESQEVWAKLMPYGHLDSENVKTTEQTGVLEKIMKGDTPVLGDFSYSPYRFLGCRIREKDEPIGIATLVEKNRFKEEDYELLVIACKAILFEMLYHEKTAMQTTPYYALFRDIIEGTTSEKEMEERCHILHIESEKAVRVLGIDFTDWKMHQLSMHFIREAFLASIPSCYSIIYRKRLLLIVEEKYVRKSLLEQIYAFLPNEKMHVDISRVCENLMGLKMAYQEIIAASEIYTLLNMDSPYLFFDEVYSYHFMENACRHMDTSLYHSYLLQQIETYDRRNGTQLAESLEGYVEAGRNIQRAAEQLHIHKNTLYYRLKRAEELFHLDLADENLCFHLQFSFRMKRIL